MNEKATLIVDGSYIVKASVFKIDYLKMKKAIENVVNTKIGDSVYFNSRSLLQNTASDNQNKFFNFLKSAEPIGPRFEVKISDLKQSEVQCPFCHEKFNKSVQKGVDVSIAIKMVEKAFLNKGSTTILLAGDGDFIEAIHFIKNYLNQKIVIVGFKQTLSVDMQSIADQVIFLEDIKEQVEKR